MSSPGTWASFAQDPRRPEAAGLRASDRDREIVLGVLGDGYADGRLTKDEYDERATAATVAKTLGELPALIVDLVPPPVHRPADDLAHATPEDLHALAVRSYESARRNAVSGALMAGLLLTAIWGISDRGFYWPVFVLLFAGIHLVRVVVNREDLVAEELRRLEKKQRRALRGRGDPPTR